MKIMINNSLMTPIYEQIVDQVKALIRSGELKENDNLPSVRALAKELRISALTVKKAYDNLEAEGFAVTVHGKGTYVAATNTERLLEEQKKEGRKLCVVEAALFLEEHYQEFCDEVWYIHTDEEIRIQRLMNNRGYTREKSLGIIGNQASEDYFRAHTDFVVENNGNVEKTWKQIDEGVRRNETL